MVVLVRQWMSFQMNIDSIVMFEISVVVIEFDLELNFVLTGFRPLLTDWHDGYASTMDLTVSLDDCTWLETGKLHDG